MKQETEEIIAEKLNKLNKYFRRTGGRFKDDSIHSFRLEVKKLRSFLKLVEVSGRSVSFPKRLKKLYRILGNIRLVQLHRQAIIKAAGKFNISKPAFYLISLKNERHKLKKDAKKYIRKIKPLRTDMFCKDSPDSFTWQDSRRYFDLQKNKLGNLLHLTEPDEESLHDIRKAMKGILYDLPYLKDENRRSGEFNKAWAADMKLLESKIGKFHDITAYIRLLKNALNGIYGIREKLYLTLILNEWENDKEDLKRLITKLGLHLSAEDIKAGPEMYRTK
jgi:CHAD domain-containing protein